MSASKLSRELAQEAIDAVTTHTSEVKAAAALGISRGTLQSRIRIARVYKLTAKTESPNSERALKAQIARLTSELRTAGQRDDESTVIKGIIGTLKRRVEEAPALDWTINARGKEGAPGVPTLFLSDLHWGERVAASQVGGVNSYGIAIAHQRMEECVRSAIHLLKILSPKMDYPGIVLPLGGDMISGNIHDELTATNELNTMPTVEDLYSVLVGVINKMTDTFGAVFLPCVSGNHGRDTRKIWGKDRHATSFDWLLYRFLALRFDNDPRVTFYIPDGSDAYYRVFNHRYLLTHGDQFRGGDSMIGCLGPILRGDHKKRSRNAQVDQEYDTLLLGHWHQYIHHSRVIVNGSLKGYDEYAYQNNFGFEPPQQALWITHPKYRLTYRMPVYVDKYREPAKTAWVSVPG